MPLPVQQRESAEQIYALVAREIRPHWAQLARCSSTAELVKHPVYRQIEHHIRRVLETPEMGDFRRFDAAAKDRYRVLAWNLERGIEYERQLEELQTHPYLRECDVLLLTETDVGMARSKNRPVAQELARELGMAFAFSPCYINLSKGAGLEHQAAGENELGLHGNAVLSHYPIRRARPAPLKNGKDKMSGREKRIGNQTAVVAEIEFPGRVVTMVSVHLDAQSSQRHRRDQMRDVLDAVEGRQPAVIGGDWNTTTYNSSRARHAIGGFWVRVLLGPDNVIRNHYLHPYRRFERELFEMLESRGFDYRRSNVLGEHTTSYDVEDVKTHKNLREWVPGWCFAFIRWALRNHGGKCPLKIDWFATRGLDCRHPVVLHEFREQRQPPLSDHDAIGIEIVV